MEYCSNCGKKQKLNIKFCTNCGSKLKEPISNIVSKNEPTTNGNVTPNTTNKTIGNKKTNAKNVLIYYFLINIPLYILNTGVDEIIGVQIFSLIILITFILRLKKEKFVNWFMKIIFVLQSILIFSIFMTQSEYLFSNLFSALITLSLLALFCITIVLLFKRNKTQ
ncbi:zinc-ribbon domain-containing protein [uncultured Lutibacter sp.]|uniref:zinc-ribbon domain-containing protein n=1 Tax=uncultured Lutibacter sp. TaxID=437739 RepID=UPI00345D1F55